MCDGGISIASLAMATASTMASGMAAKNQAKAQAKQAENAARVEEIRGQQAMEQAAEEIQAFDRDAARKRGSMMTNMAASGLDTTSGSPLLALMDLRKEQAIDRQNIGYGGQAQAWNHYQNAASLQSQASGYRAAGNNALTGSLLDASGSLLGKAGALKFDTKVKDSASLWKKH